MSQWVPAFLTLNRRRLRTQARFVGLAVLVGLVAGLGAILFHQFAYLYASAAFVAFRLGWSPRRSPPPT